MKTYMSQQETLSNFLISGPKEFKIYPMINIHSFVDDNNLVILLVISQTSVLKLFRTAINHIKNSKSPRSIKFPKDCSHIILCLYLVISYSFHQIYTCPERF